MTNPLLSAYSLPPLDAIKAADYMPAIDKAIEGVERKVAKIKASTAAPTFENTVVPLDGLFAELVELQLLLGNQALNTYTDELAELDGAVTAKVSNLAKTIFQDQALGARFQAVYAQTDKLKLDDDDKAILRGLHRSFESSGALLSPEGQARIRAIDEQLINLSTAFKKNMKAAPLQQAFLVTDKTELAGLSDDEIEGLAAQARENGHKEGWLFIPERLLVDEWLESAESSSFRKKMCDSLEAMGKPANEPVLAEIQKLRHEYATLLGYDSYAAFARSRAMMNDLPATRKLLDEIADKALPKFEEEMRGLEKFAAANGGPATLEPWDVPFWAAKQRKALFNFDANDFAKHLPMESVLKGMFNEATQLFGLEFRENTGKVPVMHPDTRSYEVIDKATGESFGLLMLDLYARPGTKNGGAWMSPLQSKDGDKPNIVMFNMNINKPPKGKQALVALGQYITMYHEFGHSLQGILGLKVKYPSLQGTAGPSDFVEFHSMVNEHRGVVRENLQQYALHVESGKPPSDATIDTLLASQSFFQSRELLKVVQNSLRDIAFHATDPAQYKGTDAVEKDVALDSPYAAHIRPYSLTRFDHLFSDAHSSYAAGYVNYLIAHVHAADGFTPFEKDPYNAEWAARLKGIYVRGSGGDPAELYKAYRGKAATTEALLREAGIDAKPVAKKAAGPKKTL